MQELHAATAQVATPVNIPFMKDVIARTCAARKDFAHVQPKDADIGQLWRVKTPVPLWDTIDPEHNLGQVEFVIFIADRGYDTEYEDFQDGEYYGFLCLGTSCIENFPVLEAPLERWQHAPYAWWVDIKTPQGQVPAHSAEFVLPVCPVYVRREWLVACEGDLGGREAVSRVINQFVDWADSDGPGLDYDHHRNKVGGHRLSDIIEHVKACWNPN